MARILVAGLINVETTLRVTGFPVPYEPVRFPFFGVRSTVSGVGWNVARALGTLGHDVTLAAMIGGDAMGGLVSAALAEEPFRGEAVLPVLDETPQSVILVEPSGRRAISSDLKDIQERTYPPDGLARALVGAELAVLCNINFARPWLAEARRLGTRVASDVHAITGRDDTYNADWMRAADILFLSHERLTEPPERFARHLLAGDEGPGIVVIGMGAAGALLALRDEGTIEHVPAVTVRPVVNTVGAGDALFSAFLHTLLHTADPRAALDTAVLYAGYKIGAMGGADGLLDAAGLAALTEAQSAERRVQSERQHRAGA